MCLERVLATGRLFGLLPNCEHCVCLPCIREWRSSETVASSAARGCPICRVVSPYVVPSRVFVTAGARKEEVRAAYLATLAARPCKHFDGGRGTCPFGSSCFYTHRMPDGRLAQPAAPRVAYGCAREAAGAAGARGDVAAARLDSLTLSDFFSGAAGGVAAYVDADDAPAHGVWATADASAALLSSLPTVDRRSAVPVAGSRGGEPQLEPLPPDRALEPSAPHELGAPGPRPPPASAQRDADGEPARGEEYVDAD